MTGKRIFRLALHHSVTIREENATAALEVMSRFAVDPKWLIYLPPTMSPPGDHTMSRVCSNIPGQGVRLLHQGKGVDRGSAKKSTWARARSRLICRDEQAAAPPIWFSIGGSGIIYTRTGRRFFDALDTQAELLGVVRQPSRPRVGGKNSPVTGSAWIVS